MIPNEANTPLLVISTKSSLLRLEEILDRLRIFGLLQALSPPLILNRGQQRVVIIVGIRLVPLQVRSHYDKRNPVLALGFLVVFVPYDVECPVLPSIELLLPTNMTKA